MSAAQQSFLPGLAPNAVAQQIQDRGADVATAIFRLVKNTLVHSMDNDAVAESIARALETLQAFTREVGSAATITFADDTVFVCGQLLRASRGVYESAVELGKTLARVGVSELCFEPEVSRAGLHQLGSALALALRDPARRQDLLQAKLPGIVVRAAEPVLAQRKREDETPTSERVVRFYATALVVMRKFHEDIAAGRRLVPHRVKRLAQRLVVLAEDKHPALIGISALAAAHRDDAARAVQSAILAVLLAREITSERQALVRLAMSALLADAGRLRLAAGASTFLGSLSDDEESRVPAVTALFCIATGGINPHSAERTVTVFETTWLERAALLGPSRLGDSPLPQAEILAFVRTLVDHLAPRDSRSALSPAEALDAMTREPRTSRFLLRLMLNTLGMIPAGSVVELDGGQWAVVIGPSAHAANLPLVRLVTDAKGQPLSVPVELDLGSPGQRAGSVRRVLGSAETRFNVTRAFLQ